MLRPGPAPYLRSSNGRFSQVYELVTAIGARVVKCSSLNKRQKQSLRVWMPAGLRQANLPDTLQLDLYKRSSELMARPFSQPHRIEHD